MGSPTGSCAYAQSSCGTAASNVSQWMGVTTSCSTFPASTFSFYQTIGSIGATSQMGNVSFYIAYADSVVVRLNGVTVFTGDGVVASITTQPWMFFQLVSVSRALFNLTYNVLEVRVTNAAVGVGGFNLYFVSDFISASLVSFFFPWFLSD